MRRYRRSARCTSIRSISDAVGACCTQVRGRTPPSGRRVGSASGPLRDSELGPEPRRSEPTHNSHAAGKLAGSNVCSLFNEVSLHHTCPLVGISVSRKVTRAESMACPPGATPTDAEIGSGSRPRRGATKTATGTRHTLDSGVPCCSRLTRYALRSVLSGQSLGL